MLQNIVVWAMLGLGFGALLSILADWILNPRRFTGSTSKGDCMADDYIFLSGDPLAKFKIAESEFVRGFESTLTPMEKDDVRKYIEYLKWPIATYEEKMKRNLAVMCFIDGQRYLRVKTNNLDPTYAEALFNVAVREIAEWSHMTEDTVRKNLVEKINNYVIENKKSQIAT